MNEIEKLARELAETTGGKQEEVMLFKTFLLCAYQKGREDAFSDYAQTIEMLF